VFFVISGYLISRNILTGCASGTFSFYAFYIGRMRRLLPALIATVSVTFLLGLLFLPPVWLTGVAGESSWALLGISNIKYWDHAFDYFTTTPDHFALMHVWSLSVEEQFYLVWAPLLVLCVRMVGMRRTQFVVLGLCATSFAAAQICLTRDPSAAFFLPVFRVFEFGIGALLVPWEKRFPAGGALADAAFCFGIAAIVYAVLRFTPATSDPGWPILLPVLGTACIIYSGTVSGLSALLTNRLCVGLGLISYSIYLCHWPILFFYQVIVGRAPASAFAIGALLAVTLATAALMYAVVETPFRRRARRRDAAFVTACVVAIALGAGIARAAITQNGWDWRLTDAQKLVDARQRFAFDLCMPIGNGRCVFGDPHGPLAVEMLGDSFVHQYAAALKPLLRDRHLRAEAYDVQGCLMLVSIRSIDSAQVALCDRIRQIEIDRIRSGRSLVVMGQSWSDYFLAAENGDRVKSGSTEAIEMLRSAVERTIEDLGGPSRRFLIIGAQVRAPCVIDRVRLAPSPLGLAPNAACSGLTAAAAKAETGPVNDMLRSVQARHRDNVLLLIPEDYLCDAVCHVMDDNLWLYQDQEHLTVAGSEFVGARARGLLQQALDGRPP
jgi:peptidoglycan/LPS O-acetylase OafA/YrhL